MFRTVFIEEHDMKRIGIGLALSALMALVFSSCASTAFKSHKTTIELEGNPSTGYTWVHEIADDTVVTIDEDVQYLGKKGMVGAPSRFVYTIHSVKEGNTTITFEYKRPWEQERAETVRAYDVTVDGTGNITVQEK